MNQLTSGLPLTAATARADDRRGEQRVIDD